MEILAKTAYTNYVLYRSYLSYYGLVDDTATLTVSEIDDFVKDILDPDEIKMLLNYSQSITGFWPEI